MTGASEDARLGDPALVRLIAGTGRDGAARLSFWQAATGGLVAPDPDLERRLAAGILDAMGQVPADRLLARRGPMLARAASAARAGVGPGPGLRHDAAPGDVVLAARRHPYAAFFAVEEVDYRFRRFDGSFSPLVTRAVFVGCDAVTVLPYDPVRDRVLVIEQMRAAPFVRQEANPWQIEAIAGRIDAGETPEEAARREAEEEAGLTLGPLMKVAEYYPTTAAFSEYLYSYVGLADLPDGCAGIHGVAGEAEDIRGHLLPYAAAAGMLTLGQVTNAPLLISLLWLDRHRPRLQGGSGAGI